MNKMSRSYMFKGHSRYEFECPSSTDNPIKRYSERSNKKIKLEEVYWKVDQEYGPVEEKETLFNLKRYVHGYMRFKNPVTIRKLDELGQGDFTYVACHEGYEPKGHFIMFSNT